MRPLLPTRPGNAHKGSVGRVLVAGGYRNYTGAPSLAALGAYRTGAGLVTVAYPADCAISPPPEAVRLPLLEWGHAELQAVRAEAVAVGMGAGAGGLRPHWPLCSWANPRCWTPTHCINRCCRPMQKRASPPC